LKPDLGPKVKYTEGVKTCATAEQQKTLCTGVVADTRFIKPKIATTLHLDENIGTIWHKRSMLVNGNTAECGI